MLGSVRSAGFCCAAGLLEAGWSLMAAAEAAGVSERTAREWPRRFEREGEAGVADRSSAPGRVANKTPEHTIQAITALRRLRFTGAQIAELLDMARSTVSGILKEIGLGKLGGWSRRSHPTVTSVAIPASSSTSTSSDGVGSARGAAHRATRNRVAAFSLRPTPNIRGALVRPRGVSTNIKRKAPQMRGFPMRRRGLEPPPGTPRTRPSTLRVYQFRHRRVGGRGGPPRARRV